MITLQYEKRGSNEKEHTTVSSAATAADRTGARVPGTGRSLSCGGPESAGFRDGGVGGLRLRSFLRSPSFSLLVLLMLVMFASNRRFNAGKEGRHSQMALLTKTSDNDNKQAGLLVFTPYQHVS